MMRLESPEMLYLLALLPAFWLGRWVWAGWRRRALLSLAEPKLLGTLSEPRSRMKSWTKAVLQSLALLLLVLALANPQYGSRLQTVERKGADLVFALDVSRSMLCRDAAPDRLTYARQLISKTLDRLGGDRVGLVIYAGSTFPQLPLTTDYAAARMLLQSASPDLVSAQGTALAEALETAADMFDPNSAAGKVLVVISDGEDHEAGWEEVLPSLREKGIEVFAIGAGTEEGGPIPQGGSQFKKDRQGEVVITRLNPATLASLASQGGGEYLENPDLAGGADAIRGWLDGKQTGTGEEQRFTQYDDQYVWLLAGSLLCVFLDLLTGTRTNFWITKLAP